MSIEMDINDQNKTDLNAVTVKNVFYEYRNSVKVIKNLSLTVKKGEIFAILGANGCGKTTLLKMMVGQLKPDFGIVRVFGVNPRSKHSDIPGPGVGFMPQEIALFNEFTIEEMFVYFAKLFHLSSDEVNNRINHLIELLNLPEKHRIINELSGGQKRLVSLAVTIMHRPKLVILDEPTVGVDSILRCRIWMYLEDMCCASGITIIITTHYIEEAKKASNVGFIKSGSVLKQSNPQKLMIEYQCKTLEAVYLHLWQHNDRMIANSHRSGIVDFMGQLPIVDNYCDPTVPKKPKYLKKTIDLKRISAIIWKLYVQTKRNPMFFILFNLVPVIALTTMHTTIGQLPYNIPISVFNAEPEPKLSKLFVDVMNKKYLNVKQYDSKESAIDTIVKGKGVFAVIFDQNFTKNFETRLQRPFEMTEQEVYASTTRLYVDFSDSVVALYVLHYFAETFFQFVRNVSTSLGLNPNFFALPYTFKEPIYGQNFITDNHMENLKTFSELLTPGLLVTLFHLISMSYSAFIIIKDRKECRLDRFFIAGGQPIEVLIAIYFQQIILVLIQVFLGLVCAFGVFGIRQVGSYFDVYAICVLQALQGMSIGLFLSILFYDEVSVAIGLSALMFPIWIMSGVFWPLEAIPTYFRWLADWTPLTKPIESFRSMMTRGWTYPNQTVMLGFFVSLSYTYALTIFSVLLFQIFSFNSLSFNNLLF